MSLGSDRVNESQHEFVGTPPLPLCALGLGSLGKKSPALCATASFAPPSLCRSTIFSQDMDPGAAAVAAAPAIVRPPPEVCSPKHDVRVLAERPTHLKLRCCIPAPAALADCGLSRAPSFVSLIQVFCPVTSVLALSFGAPLSPPKR